MGKTIGWTRDGKVWVLWTCVRVKIRCCVGGNKGISFRNVDVRERFSRNLQIRADRSRLLYTLMGMDFEELREF